MGPYMLVYHTHTSARTHRHTRISTHKHSDTHTHTLKLMCVSSCLHFHVCHRRRRRCPARCAVIRTSSSPGLALHRNTHTHTLYRTHSASYTDAHSVAHKHTHTHTLCTHTSPRIRHSFVLSTFPSLSFLLLSSASVFFFFCSFCFTCL